MTTLSQKAWVIYSKVCLQRAETIVDYLSRYDYLANTCRKKILKLIRVALGVPQKQDETSAESALFDGIPCTLCQQGHMAIQGMLAPIRLKES